MYRETCARCGKLIWVNSRGNVNMEVCKICDFRIKFDLKEVPILGRLGTFFDITRLKLRRLRKKLFSR